MKGTAIANSPTFFLTAAEHSGDALGEALIHALRRRFPDAVFVGVGGERMAAAGCRLLANPIGGSAMFLGALVKGSVYWWRLLKQIEKQFVASPPSVVVPIDSSAVNLRIAAVAKRHKLPVCYYVAPQVWASRPWRVKKIRERVDTLCCILPFEEKYFTERHVKAIYVGHPMFDFPAADPKSDPASLKPPLPGVEGSVLAHQSRLIEERAGRLENPRIAIFPGSRRAEIDSHMPPMLEILSEIKGRFPGASFVAVAPSEERAWQIRHHLRNANTPVDIRVGGTAAPATADAVIRWADLVLVKSGTGTLQVARHHKPMVVIFAVAWWKWHLFARFFITTPFIALVNIIAGREVVPEFIPFYGSPLPVARKCIELLSNAAMREQISAQLAELVKPLHPREGVLAADLVAAEVAKLVQ